jgi:hypothetical protein
MRLGIVVGIEWCNQFQILFGWTNYRIWIFSTALCRWEEAGTGDQPQCARVGPSAMALAGGGQNQPDVARIDMFPSRPREFRLGEQGSNGSPRRTGVEWISSSRLCCRGAWGWLLGHEGTRSRRRKWRWGRRGGGPNLRGATGRRSHVESDNVETRIVRARFSLFLSVMNRYAGISVSTRFGGGELKKFFRLFTPDEAVPQNLVQFSFQALISRPIQTAEFHPNFRFHDSMLNSMPPNTLCRFTQLLCSFSNQYACNLTVLTKLCQNEVQAAQPSASFT